MKPVGSRAIAARNVFLIYEQRASIKIQLDVIGARGIVKLRDL